MLKKQQKNISNRTVDNQDKIGLVIRKFITDEKANEEYRQLETKLNLVKTKLTE